MRLNPELIEIDLNDVVFDETIYPRKEHNAAKVQEYAANIEAIEAVQNFIHLSRDNKVLDGRHRHLAYITNANGKPKTIQAFKHDVGAPDDLLLAIELNSSHGQQLSQADKRRNCIILYNLGFTLDTIASLVSVGKKFAQEATKAIRDEETRQRNETIFDMYLACHTQQDIADVVGMKQPDVAEKIKTFIEKVPKNYSYKSHENDDGFTVPIYNIWNFGKKSNEGNHFGNSEQRIVDNLLYLYTDPFDIVVDPFAGFGSTMDVCRPRLRRYHLSDLKPIPARENDIRQMDIAKELPPLNRLWSDVSLTYLDPPYWKQAEGQYSDLDTDLANMSLDDFHKSMIDIVKRIASKQRKGVIALLIQPTQWKAPDRQYTDHVTEIIKGVNSKKLTLHNRVSCPYATEQYNPQMVDTAKDEKLLLVLTRELIVWKVG